MSFVVQLGGRSPRSNRVLIWVSGSAGLQTQYGDQDEHTASWHQSTSEHCEIEWAAGAAAHRELAKMRQALDLAELAPALEPGDLDEHERIAHDTSASMKLRADHYIAAEQARERIDHAGVQVEFAGINEVGTVLLSSPEMPGTWGLHPDQHEHMATQSQGQVSAAHRALAAMRRALEKVADTDRHWMSSVDHLLIAAEVGSPFTRRALHYLAAQHALNAEEKSGRSYRYTSTETRLQVRPAGTDTAEVVLSDLNGDRELSIEVPTDRAELKTLLETLARAGGHEDLLGMRRQDSLSHRVAQREVSKTAPVTTPPAATRMTRSGSRTLSAVREMAGAHELLGRRALPRPDAKEAAPRSVIPAQRGGEVPLTLERLTAAIAAAGIHAVDCSVSRCSCWVRQI